MKKLILFFLILNSFQHLAFGQNPDTAYPKITFIGSIPAKGDTIRALDLLNDYKWHTQVKDQNQKIIITGYDKFESFKFSENQTVLLSQTFELDSSILFKNLVIQYYKHTTFVLKVNGHIVLESGRFKRENRSNDYLRASYEYFNISFTDKNVKFEIEYKTAKHGSPYTLFKIGTEDWKQNEIKLQNSKRIKNVAISTFYMAFTLVFLFYYLFLKVNIENLYFALFCLFSGLGSFLPEISLPNNLKLFQLFANIISLEFLSMFLSKIILNTNRNKIGLLIITLLSILSFIPFLNFEKMVNEVSIIAICIFILPFLYCATSILFYLIKGLTKKKWEARLITIGGIISIVVPFVTPIIFNMFTENHATLNIGVQIGPSLSVLMIPVTMSVVLGKRNANNQVQLANQVREIEILSEEKQSILENQNKVLEEKVVERTAEVVAERKEVEKQKDLSEQLLLNILPSEVAEELKQKGKTEAKQFDEVTVMFTDFKNFTQVSEKLAAKALVEEIHKFYSEFDKISSKHNLEKIKTMGDSYMCAGGLPVANVTNGFDTVNAALDICDFMLLEKQKNEMEGKPYFEIRIGLHTGPVVAGIVGIKKFSYDIWGDTVNIASRMESSGEAGKVNISGSTYNIVKDKFNCTYRGKIQAKNKGEIDMYFVEKTHKT